MEWLAFVQIVAIPLFVALATAVYKVHDKHSSFVEKHNDDLNKLSERHGEEIDSLRAQQAAWQLEVVKNYVTRPEIERLEMRIVQIIERLEGKMEKYFTKGIHGGE